MEENTHERLKQRLSELEQEWTAMKTGKSSSAVSCLTIEDALERVDISPRKLMLSLQASPEAEVIPMSTPLRSPFRKRLFDDDSEDDEREAVSFSHSSCWSSNVRRVRDDTKMKKKRGSVVMVLLLMLLALVVLINGFDYYLVDREHIHTLVPT